MPKIKVNQTTGQLPLIGDLTPTRFIMLGICLVIAIIVYLFSDNWQLSLAVFLWSFATSSLLAGKRYWEYINKWRRAKRFRVDRHVVGEKIPSHLFKSHRESEDDIG